MAKNQGKRRKEVPAEPVVADVVAVEELVDTVWYAEAFKALGDQTRLRMVLFLRSAEGESEAVDTDAEPGRLNIDGTKARGVTVGAIARHLTGSDQVSSNVSHHLKELRHAGIVIMKRRGKNILCRLDDRALRLLGGILGARAFVDDAGFYGK
jgi:DNA-binding transcriptional ArsR family regulator